MTLLMLLLGLAARRLQQDALWALLSTPLTRFHAWLLQRERQDGLTPAVALAALVSVPALLLVILVYIVSGFWFDLLSWLLAGAVIVWLLALPREQAVLARCRERWAAREWQAAYETGLQGQLLSAVDSAIDLHREVLAAQVQARLQDTFSLIFWFALTGPVGALVYHLFWLAASQHEEEPDSARLARYWLELMDWVPARLLALAFALVGDFVSAMTPLRRLVWDGRVAAREFLVAAALGALRLPALAGDEAQLAERGEAQFQEVEALLVRALGVWLVLIALLTLAASFH